VRKGVRKEKGQGNQLKTKIIGRSDKGNKEVVRFKESLSNIRDQKIQKHMRIYLRENESIYVCWVEERNITA